MNVDAQDLRYARMARQRELLFAELRRHYHHLPPPVVAAVYQLCDYLMGLRVTPDEDLEKTVVR